MTDNNPSSQKLELISIFHYVLAAFIFIKGAGALIMMGIGTLLTIGILSDQPHDMEEGLIVIGLIFFVFPMLVLLVSWTLATLVLLAGRRISKRTNLAYCQIVAGLECLCAPFGTILGIFSLINLTKPEVKETFET